MEQAFAYLNERYSKVFLRESGFYLGSTLHYNFLCGEDVRFVGRKRRKFVAFRRGIFNCQLSIFQNGVEISGTYYVERTLPFNRLGYREFGAGFTIIDGFTRCIFTCCTKCKPVLFPSKIHIMAIAKIPLRIGVFTIIIYNKLSGALFWAINKTSD